MVCHHVPTSGNTDVREAYIDPQFDSIAMILQSTRQDVTVYVGSLRRAHSFKARMSNVEGIGALCIIHELNKAIRPRGTKMVFIVTPVGEWNFMETTPLVLDYGNTFYMYNDGDDSGYGMLPQCRIRRRKARTATSGMYVRLFDEVPLQFPRLYITMSICESISPTLPLSQRAGELFREEVRAATRDGFVTESGKLGLAGELHSRFRLSIANSRILARSRSHLALLLVTEREDCTYPEGEDLLKHVGKMLYKVDQPTSRFVYLLGDRIAWRSETPANLTRIVADVIGVSGRAYRIQGEYYYLNGKIVTLNMGAPARPPAPDVIVCLHSTWWDTITSYIEAPSDTPGKVFSVTRLSAHSIPDLHERLASWRRKYMSKGVLLDARKSCVRVTGVPEDVRGACESLRGVIRQWRSDMLNSSVQVTVCDNVRLVMRPGGVISDVLFRWESVSILVPNSVKGSLHFDFSETHLTPRRNHTEIRCRSRHHLDRLVETLHGRNVVYIDNELPPNPDTLTHIIVKFRRHPGSSEEDPQWALKLTDALGIVAPYMVSPDEAIATISEDAEKIGGSVVKAWEGMAGGGFSASVRLCFGPKTTPFLPCTVDDYTRAIEERQSLVIHDPALCRLAVWDPVHVVHHMGEPNVRILSGSLDDKRKMGRHLCLRAAETEPRASAQHCPVCYESTATKVLKGCGHFMCPECLTHMIDADIGGDKLIICPHVECKTPIFYEDIEAFADPAILSTWKRSKLQRYITRHPYAVPHCPSCHAVPPSRPERRWMDCKSCNETFCLTCSTNSGEVVVDHQGPCIAMSRGPIDRELANMGVYPCPSCGSLMQRESGCSHMTCPVPLCGSHHCYGCRIEFTADILSPDIQGTVTDVLLRVRKTPDAPIITYHLLQTLPGDVAKGTVLSPGQLPDDEASDELVVEYYHISIQVDSKTWPSQCIFPPSGILYLKPPRGRTISIGDMVATSSYIYDHVNMCSHPSRYPPNSDA